MEIWGAQIVCTRELYRSREEIEQRIGNTAALLPTYDPTRDEIARGTLQELFPTRRVVPTVA